MPVTMNRVMVSIPNDLEKEINRLKREEFYNKSYAELYRCILRRGLEAMKDRESENASGSQENRPA